MAAKSKQKAEVTVKFAGGTVVKVPTGSSISQAIKNRLGDKAEQIICAKLNGKPVDLSHKLEHDADVELIDFNSNDGKQVFWHSATHILAQALTELHPEAKPTIGPAIETGFYYDFEVKPLNAGDLAIIENKMREIVKRDIPVERIELQKQQALKLFANNPYKLELIEEHSKDPTMSAYKQGEYIDFCRGPHAPTTGYIRAVKLLKAAPAYWHGDQTKAQLQRVYGVAFPEESMLQEHLHMLEEAEKRDHRRLGRELDLYSFHEEAPGSVFFHHKGLIIWEELLHLIRTENAKRGYIEIRSPQIMTRRLWETSGHWTKYREKMYFTNVEKDELAVKPMNCPGAILYYRERKHSYRELPLRIAELTLLHRAEKSGELIGILRTREFVQDDAHIFVTPDQVLSELANLIALVADIYAVFGFPYYVELSVQPETYIGTRELWVKAEESLRKALDARGLKYKLNPGEGAFYGPKIDFHIKDSLGRTWQCATIQLDLNLPERFDVTYVGEDNSEHRAYILHRVVLGSLERFIGVLTEHYAGKFPLWLSPTQIRILNIATRHEEYAVKVAEQLRSQGIRAEADLRNETLQAKIRDAHNEKVNYIGVVGDREIAERTVTLRTRENQVLGSTTMGDAAKLLLEEIKTKK